MRVIDVDLPSIIIVVMFTGLIAVGIWSLAGQRPLTKSSLDVMLGNAAKGIVNQLREDLAGERAKRQKLEIEIGVITSRARETHDEQLSKIAQLEREIETQAHNYSLQISELEAKIDNMSHKLTAQVTHWQERAITAENELATIKAKSEKRKL